MTPPIKTDDPAKKPYRSPVLTVYGSVKEMTGGGTTGNIADTNAMNMVGTSDPALKENIVRVGEHSAGFGLYLFNYKPNFSAFGEGRQFGAMADEVERIVPEAVSIGSHGYRMVDYGMLGITRH